MARDYHLLHFRRSLVDAQRPYLAVEALDRHATGDAEAAEHLHGLVDDGLGAIGGVELGERRLAAVALALDVAEPGGALTEQRPRLDLHDPPGQLPRGDGVVG